MNPYTDQQQIVEVPHAEPIFNLSTYFFIVYDEDHIASNPSLEMFIHVIHEITRKIKDTLS